MRVTWLIKTWRIHTERRRPIGCLTLQVIFRKIANNYRALLRKRTYQDKAWLLYASDMTHSIIQTCLISMCAETRVYSIHVKRTPVYNAYIYEKFCIWKKCSKDSFSLLQIYENSCIQYTCQNKKRVRNVVCNVQENPCIRYIYIWIQRYICT